MILAKGMRRSLAIATLFVALAAGSAQATSPGVNGKIYFQACDSVCSGNPDGSGLENVTEAVTDAPGPPDSAWDPSVSADGSVMTFGVDSQATSEESQSRQAQVPGPGSGCPGQSRPHAGDLPLARAAR